MKRKIKIKYFKLDGHSEYYITMGDKRIFLWYDKRDTQHSVNALVTWGEWKKIVRENFEREVIIKEVSDLEMLLVCGTDIVSSGRELLEKIMDEDKERVRRRHNKKRRGSE